MIEVIAGIIINKEKEILITRRKFGKHLAGFWEFPGGKLETNESPEECLAREIKEELDINISVGKHITNSVFKYETINICLKGYYASYINGVIKLTDHDAYQWVTIEQLRNYKFAPADIPIIKAIKNEF